MVNSRALQLYGYTPTERVKMPERAEEFKFYRPGNGFFPPEKLPARRAMRDGETVRNVELEIEHPDGTRILATENAAPLRDEENRIVGAVGTFEDITERRRAEDALRESEALFHSLAENANAMIGISRETRYVYVNPYFSQLSGYSRDELLAMDFGQIIAPESRATVLQRAQLRQSGDRSIPLRYDFAMLTKDGQVRWVDFAAALTEYHGQPAIIWIAYDITERRQAEQEREQLLSRCSTAWKNSMPSSMPSSTRQQLLIRTAS